MNLHGLLFLVAIVASDWLPPKNPCLCQEFRCENGTSCLHKSRVCNNYKDCPNGEDELNFDKSGSKCSIADAKKIKCGPDEFKCKFGGCIKLTEVCDGEINCFGGVDEATDFCLWVHGNSTGPSPLL